MSPAKSRKRERGNTMVLSLIILSALATLGTLTVISVQSSLKASTNDRSQSLALYAAESGAAFVMEYLRYHFDATPMTSAPGLPPYSRPKAWSALVSPLNSAPVSLDGLVPTSGQSPAVHPFGTGIVAWYTTKIFNNKDDVPAPYIGLNPGPPPTAVSVPYPSTPPTSGYVDGADYDGRVIIQITGHGPQGSTAILEVEVQWPIQQQLGVPAPTIPLPPPNGPALTLIGWHVVNL